MILGGGITGLYAAYLILKHNPDQNVVVLEKDARLGGRIHTYTDKHMTVEAGAGRFSTNHTLLMDLLREFKLLKKVRPTSSEIKYAEGSPYSLRWVVGKIVAASLVDVFHDLDAMTFLEYAKKIVSEEETDFLQNAFGYYTELVVMNAKDAIALLHHLDEPFNVLDGGLSQVVDELARRIRMYPNASIRAEEVVSIKRARGAYQIQTRSKSSTHVYVAPWCICALPKQVLETFPISLPIQAKLRKIVCGPLCRIYCTFREPWFGRTKYTTATPLRIVIPINARTIMISYTDNVFADYWNDVHQREGIAGVNRALKHFIREAFNKEMPPPVETKVFYWPCGVGYWGVRSEGVAEQLIEPFSRFYLCGEQYSKGYQQWMEGGLETAKVVCERLREAF